MGIDFTGGNLFFVLLLFAAGLLCVIKGGDFFVDAATWIAEASRIPKFIIGATVVSFATTMPEMMVSVFAAFEGNADIAVGNAVGSVTANTGLIMCLSLVCLECMMPRRQYAVKACLLLGSVAVLCAFTRDGQLSIIESVVILLFFAGFMADSLISAKREHGAESNEIVQVDTSGKNILINIGKFLLGAAAIVLGAQLLIDNGTALAQLLHVPDSIIGANIMDITLIMPLCALLLGKPLTVENQGMLLDIPACLIISAGALVPALICGRFKRWIGFFIGGLYIVYLVIMFACFGV